MSEAEVNRLEQAIDILDALVAFDTESTKSNWPIVRWIENFLHARDIPFVTVPNAEGDKAAIFATIGPLRDGGIVLSGHTDVVPVEGQAWSSDPFKMRRDGARLYGRGTTDMKGFDACALAMVDVWRKQELQHPVHILLSYDEELTCQGPVDTIKRFGKDLPVPRAVIVGEPTLMQVADAHKAIATYLTVVTGHEAHSSMPQAGANAIEVGAMLVVELYRIQAELAAQGVKSPRFDPSFSTISVGTIHGGTARNILARECALHWEFRSLPGVAQGLALRKLEAYAQALALPHLRRYAPHASIETHTEVEIPGLAPDEGSEAERLALRVARSNQTIAVPFATEAGQFQSAGLPAVVFGPGSIAQAHQPDEFIEIAQLAACLDALDRMVRA
ncbi:MAG: acetylornithine deacetylase [Alphaproteobacteria bacterium]|nr:acetylornithine deacetylase [Alphaproteobacteria bacterium]